MQNMDRNPPQNDKFNELAYTLAQCILEGFNKHYRLFRAVSVEAKLRFEYADWSSQQKSQRDRIDYYDSRVNETVSRLNISFSITEIPLELWQSVKFAYVKLLLEHHQPELAETFFNSVVCKILHRDYFHNSFIFFRPGVSTEHIESVAITEQPTYRSYYPTRDTLLDVLRQVFAQKQFALPFADLERDLSNVVNAIHAELKDYPLRVSFQIHILSSLFFRNKGAYIVGRILNGYTLIPLALPILHDAKNQLYIDAALVKDNDIHALFSFARAYFLVDMEVPAAYINFLSSLMPRRRISELYNAVGLQKQGKTMFYRDLLLHLYHSEDQFVVAPGIRGMVMFVFMLPSYPYVFKIIKDHFPPQKEISREQVKNKYRLVKQHDRVGRMADTLEFSNVALPKNRFSDEVLQALQQECTEQIEINAEEVVIHHMYIERRMVPLNLYMQKASVQQLEKAIVEYGSAIKDLVAANIFPGDMLWKNFGITRDDKVVFYDYDEIEYITDCNFREVPQAPNDDFELSGEVWYQVGARDVFPETFATFLLGDATVRRIFMKYHSDLLSAKYWQTQQEHIRQGQMLDIFPYEQTKRFIVQRKMLTHEI